MKHLSLDFVNINWICWANRKLFVQINTLWFNWNFDSILSISFSFSSNFIVSFTTVVLDFPFIYYNLFLFHGVVSWSSLRMPIAPFTKPDVTSKFRSNIILAPFLISIKSAKMVVLNIFHFLLIFLNIFNLLLFASQFVPVYNPKLSIKFCGTHLDAGIHFSTGGSGDTATSK